MHLVELSMSEVPDIQGPDKRDPYNQGSTVVPTTVSDNQNLQNIQHTSHLDLVPVVVHVMQYNTLC